MKAEGWNSHSLLWLFTTKLSTLMILSLMFQTARTRQTESLYEWVFIRSKFIGLLLGAFWDPQSRQIAASPASWWWALQVSHSKKGVQCCPIKKDQQFWIQIFTEAIPSGPLRFGSGTSSNYSLIPFRLSFGCWGTGTRLMSQFRSSSSINPACLINQSYLIWNCKSVAASFSASADSHV